jgi:ATP-dependent helicase/DNAse subunit B
MVEHLRNQLAREGHVLRKGTVSTLTRFVDDLKLSHPEPSASSLESIIQSVLAHGCPLEYREVATQSGFVRHLASSCDALSLAGVRPHQLEGPLGEVYGRILKSLNDRELALRGQRLQQATQKLDRADLSGVSKILLDGFFSFSKTEEAFLAALSARIPVEVTRTESNANQPSYRQPRIGTFAATDRSHEALIIAEGILHLASQGVELRRIGILLRNPAAYAPLIESTLARLDIPSRSYLGLPITAHPVIVFHRAMLKAVDANWENADLLSALRWRLTGLGGTDLGDLLEQQVRSALPSTSLELFPQLEAFKDWPGQRYSPIEAASQLKRLTELLESPTNLSPDLKTAWQWHQRASAIRTLHEVLDSTAASLSQEPLLLSEFWQAVETNLAGLSLHERDARRNVVHVMDLFESRQWDLDYIFAPGISEGELPQRFSPDPLLPENLKKNFGMKTLEDRQAEERFLYEMLLTRASKQLTLTYPRINAKGDPVLPSPLLASKGASAKPIAIATPASGFTESAGQLERNYRQPRPWSASEFESYLACPWKHFAARGLNLQGLPETPAERLNALLLGTVAHNAIKNWTQDSSKNIEQIGERELERACREARVPAGYQYERERINLLRNLRLYARNAPPIPSGWTTYLEQSFSIELEGGPSVRGQIDRYDQSPSGEIHAYDYKYSKATGLDEKYPIQGALYAIALGPQVTRFSFIALREEARAAVLESNVLTNQVALARQMIGNIVEGVRSGKVPVQPLNPDNCKYCDYIDACRIRLLSAEEEAPAISIEAAQE